MGTNEGVDDLLMQINQQTDIFQKDELRRHLIEFVNHLLLHDFNKLVQILYRVDVDEQKLKGLLQQSPQTDAAILIADLLIQRQEEKRSTKEASGKEDSIPEDERW